MTCIAAVRHGRDVGDVGRGLRAVAWERSAGQVVQVVLALLVLLVLPSPVRSAVPVAASIALVGRADRAGVLILGRMRPRPRHVAVGTDPAGRRGRSARRGVRPAGLARASQLTSVLVVAGHTATFLVAARTAGVTAGTTTLLPLALLVLLAMAVPANVGGWGPREGVAAWAFGAAGLGAALGVTTAVVYGVLALVAALPGAVVLIADWLRRDTGRRARSARAATTDDSCHPAGRRPWLTVPTPC